MIQMTSCKKNGIGLQQRRNNIISSSIFMFVRHGALEALEMNELAFCVLKPVFVPTQHNVRTLLEQLAQSFPINTIKSCEECFVNDTRSIVRLN